jgi:hypothetical protein
MAKAKAQTQTQTPFKSARKIIRTCLRSFHDRDRGTSHGAAPPTSPGIRVRTSAVRPG